MQRPIWGTLLAVVLVSLGCSDDAPPSGSDETGDGDGDAGDGDGAPGDGDGAPGDGDGAPGDGDGAPGDGDGDGAPGDGDGAPGDGDGDGSPLPADFLDQLTDIGGCGDVYIGAINPEGTIGVLFNGAELAATAHMLGEPQVRESTLPSDDVNLRIVIGEFLDQGCNDAGEVPLPQITWTAVSGTVTLTVVPNGMQEPWQVPADATLELTDVTFEAPGQDPVVIDSWIAADVYVGWFPG